MFRCSVSVIGLRHSFFLCLCFAFYLLFRYSVFCVSVFMFLCSVFMCVLVYHVSVFSRVASFCLFGCSILVSNFGVRHSAFWFPTFATIVCWAFAFGVRLPVSCVHQYSRSVSILVFRVHCCCIRYATSVYFLFGIGQRQDAVRVMDRSLMHAEWITEVQWYRPQLYKSPGFRRVTRVVKHQRITLWPGLLGTPRFSVRKAFFSDGGAWMERVVTGFFL